MIPMAHKILSFKSKLVWLCLACLVFSANAKADNRHSYSIEPFSSDVKYTRPLLVDRDPPIYPKSASRYGTTGFVELTMMVDTEGKPFELAVLRSTSDVFHKSALAAVKGYKFNPAKVDGEPVIGRYVVTVKYEMEGQYNGVQARTIRILKELKGEVQSSSLRRARKDNLQGQIQNIINNRRNTRCGNANAYLLMQQFADKAKDRDLQIDALQLLQHFDGHMALDDYDEEQDRFNCFGSSFNVNIDLALISLTLAQGNTAAALNEMSQYDLPNTTKRKHRLVESISRFDIQKAIAKNRSTYYTIRKNGSVFIETLNHVLRITGEAEDLKTAELRCDAGYKKLSLSADTVIDIPKSYGRCQIQVIGLPETKFRVRKKRA